MMGRIFEKVIGPGIIILGFLVLGDESFAQYQINGDASQISCGCYELTADQQFLGGSVWNVTQIDLNQPFDFTFDIFLGCANGQSGGDGMAFVLQPLNVNAGSPGGGLGYLGIDPSVAIEYDTYYNDQYADLVDDHIAIMSNGVVDHTIPANTLATPVQMSATAPDIEDCSWHTTQIVWDPVLQIFAVSFDGVFRLAYNGDIINDIFGGNPNVYWGFTGSTGNRTNLQQFCISLEPQFTIDNNNACANEPVQFTESSTASNVISNYDWDFGDGATSTLQNPTHPYTTAGTYDVNLTITSDGCTETFTEQVTIIQAPSIDLGPDMTVCDGDAVQLNSPNNLGNGDFVWDPPTGLDNATIASPLCTPTSTVTYTLSYTDNGCTSTDDITITYAPAAVANAGANDSVCLNSSTQLTGSGGVTYQWDNGGTLDNSSISNPLASPTVSTTYTLEVTDANGCIDTDDVVITVDPLPTVDAGVDVTICTGNSVQLNAIGTGSFVWDPDPSLSANDISDPVATPMTNTTYVVTLTDANGCVATDDITVFSLSTLPVDAGPDVTICQGEAVQLTGSGAVNYSWDPPADLDDPDIFNPVFNGSGSVTLTLTGTDDNGCSATDDITLTVNETPVGVITVGGGADHCEGELLGIDANSSTGPITGLIFDFDDQLNTTSTTTDNQFTYNTIGTYNVTLIVNNGNCADTTNTAINISPTPVAEFTATDPCTGDILSPVNTSSISSGTINSFQWSFGNGSFSDLQNPTQMYGIVGPYEIELVVSSDMGCTDTTTQDITVMESPVIVFSSDNVCIGQASVFSNNSTPNNGSTVWEWNMGDGTLYTDHSPEHTYTATGNYTVSLQATTLEGCSSLAASDVDVNANPQVSLDASKYDGCEPLLVEFYNNTTISQGSITSFVWDLGSISGLDVVAPTINYQQPGVYSVTLTATSDQGCEASSTVANMITVNVTPDASFEIRSEEPITMLDPRIRLLNTSTDAVTYQWTFGDGGAPSNAQDPNHTYAAEGTYQVTLIAQNGDCSDIATEEVRIDPETFIYLPSAFTPNKDGINDIYYAEGTGIENFSMFIHDRWGKEMFNTSNIELGWDGKYLGKDAPLGVYVYSVDITNSKGETEKILGRITLYR